MSFVSNTYRKKGHNFGWQDFLKGSAWWPINRWKSSNFQAVCVCGAKILTKKDTKLIFFFSESCDVAFFNSDVGCTLGWTPGRLFYFEILTFHDF